MREYLRLGVALGFAIGLAASVGACTAARSGEEPAGSGSSVPASQPIDYHGFPYNIQAG